MSNRTFFSPAANGGVRVTMSKFAFTLSEAEIERLVEWLATGRKCQRPDQVAEFEKRHARRAAESANEGLDGEALDG